MTIGTVLVAPLSRPSSRCADGEQHIHFEPKQLRREVGQLLLPTPREPVKDGDVPSLNVAALLESLLEGLVPANLRLR